MFIRGALGTGSAVVMVAAAAWASKPVAVSPGSATGTVVESRCPTFNWGIVEGAESYELVVYRVKDETEDTGPPLLRQTLPGSVHGWTLAVDQCLERGGQYAWSLRAVGNKVASEWSAPSLFQVLSTPSEAEFGRAFELVRDFLARKGLETESAPESRPLSGVNSVPPPTPPRQLLCPAHRPAP